MAIRTTGGGIAAVSGGEPNGRRIVEAFLRRAPLIVACTLLTAAAALVFSLAQTKEYTASASLLFRDPGFDQRLFGASIAATSDPQREAATNITLVSLKAVAERTAATFDHGLTADDISNKVSIQSEGQSDVASVRATDSDPRTAANLANAFAQNYIAFRRDADRRKVRQAGILVTKDFNQLSPVEQQGSQGQSLQRQISRLSTLEALQTGNAELVQHATVPESPSSPKPVRNTLFGWILGLLLGLGLAALLERHDRRLRQPSDFEDTLGLPVLTEVPEDKSISRTEDSMGELLSHEASAFQMLRTRLRYFNVDRDINSVVVTSAAPGEGKTTIAWSLAASAASSGSKTILIEADFHQATIAGRTRTQPKPGLSELLSGQSTLEETVQHVSVENRQNGKVEVRRLDLLVAGSHPPNPVELLESDGMSNLLQTLSATHDLVVIDSPPLPVLADAIPLVKMVNGVILVGRVNKTTRDQAQALNAQLESLKAPVLGVVANRTSRRRGYYDYYRRSRESASVAVGSDNGAA
jgi:tyrosine-protein kinase